MQSGTCCAQILLADIRIAAQLKGQTAKHGPGVKAGDVQGRSKLAGERTFPRAGGAIQIHNERRSRHVCCSRACGASVTLAQCRIAKISIKNFIDIFAGSFAKKHGFSLTRADFIGAKPFGF
jgi:hypothetical protein